MILLIDNYDSFSYNLYQYIGEIRPDISVIRNNEKTIDEIRKMKPDHIILSPGPGRPEDAGICMQLVTELFREIPILGVCLGHQAIYAALGGVVTYAKKLMHGKQSMITVDPACPLWKGCEKRIPAARYHSLAAEKETLPAELMITATAEDGEIMGVMHKSAPLYGLQFHPESIMTPDGKTILSNFLTQ